MNPTISDPDAGSREVRFLTPWEAATLLRVHYQTVLSYARRGRLPHYRLPGGIRFREDEVMDWLKRGRA